MHSNINSQNVSQNALFNWVVPSVSGLQWALPIHISFSKHKKSLLPIHHFEMRDVHHIANTRN